MTPQQRRVYERLRADPGKALHRDELVTALGDWGQPYMTPARQRVATAVSQLKGHLPSGETLVRTGAHYTLFIAKPPKEIADVATPPF